MRLFPVELYLVAYLGLCGEYGGVDLGRDDDDRGRYLTIRLVK
jgi:hypothetical protein